MRSYGNNYVEELDKEITLNEVKEARNLLKEEKASGDGWTCNMLVNIPIFILYALQVMRNTILNKHMFPTVWRVSAVK